MNWMTFEDDLLFLEEDLSPSQLDRGSQRRNKVQSQKEMHKNTTNFPAYFTF